MGDDTSSRGYGTGPGARGAADPSDSSVDPLTELARLIGQSDPFSVDRQRGANARAADTHAPPVEWGREPLSHGSRYQAPARDASYDAAAGLSDGYAYEGPYEGQPYDEAGAEHAGEGEDYDSGPFAYVGGDHDPHHVPAFYDDEAPAPRRRGWLLTATALVGLAVIGAAGSFAYRSVFTGGPPSIIARDPGPNKIIPANQTADKPANKRLDRIASGGQDERVISREEQPIVLPETARSAPDPGNGQNLGTGFPPPSAIAPAQPSPFADNAAMPGNPALGNTPGPRKIQTVTIKGDGTPDIAGPPAAPAPAPIRLSAPPRPSPPATAAPAPNGPLSLSPQGVAQPAPPAAPARTSAITPQPQARSTESAGGYFVQVTAQRSEAEAQSSYRGIQSKYANLLGAREPVIRRKDLGSKGIFFGAQVGPLSHEAAVKLCENLKSAGGSCMIQRN